MNFILYEFYNNQQIKWTLHVDSNPIPLRYDVTIDRDLSSELGIIFKIQDQMMIPTSLRKRPLSA